MTGGETWLGEDVRRGSGGFNDMYTEIKTVAWQSAGLPSLTWNMSRESILR